MRRALDEVEVTRHPDDAAVRSRARARPGVPRRRRLSTDWVADRWDGPADRARGVRRGRDRRGVGPWRRPRPDRAHGASSLRKDDARESDWRCRRPSRRRSTGGRDERSASRPRRPCIGRARTADRRVPGQSTPDARDPTRRAATWSSVDAGPTGRATAAGAVEVVVDGWRFVLVVEDAARAELRERATRDRGERRPGAGGPLEIRAIIPGRIVGGRRRSPGEPSRPASRSSSWRR